LRDLSSTTRSHAWIHRKHALLLATALVFPGFFPLHAQSPSPSAPSDTTQQNLPSLPGMAAESASSATDSGTQLPTDPSGSASSGHKSSLRPQPTGSNLFNLPRSLTATAGGVKFQLVLPRLSFASADGRGFSSPLDSSGMPSTNGSGFSMFPSGSGSMRSTGAASDGSPGTPFNMGSMGSRNGGMSMGGVGVDVPLKTSMFDVHLSMKDLIGGSFSQNAGNSTSSGSGLFGMTGDSGAASPGAAGGLRGPGGSGKGSGPRMSLQLKF